jgi:hypothetical protein
MPKCSGFVRATQTWASELTNGCTFFCLFFSYDRQEMQQQLNHVAEVAHLAFVRLCCNKHISSFCSLW